LVEIIIVVMVLSVWVVSAIAFVTNWLNFTKITRQKVIAINFAREGIESVYQIRDTNRQRWQWKKDQCWLKTNPLVDDGSVWCENDTWMWSWNYTIVEVWSTSKYFVLSWVNWGWFDLSKWMSWNNISYRLCFSSGYWKACPWADRNEWFSSEGIFLRQITGKWVFLKNTNTAGWDYIPCTDWTTNQCGSNTAKEYRFCSRVWYMGGTQGEIEICSLMTNFLE